MPPDRWRICWDWEEANRQVYSDPNRLAKVVGGFGSENLDLGALSTVLQRSRSSRVMEQARHRRLQQLRHDLADAVARLEAKPPAPAIHDLNTPPESILKAYETHMAPLGELLRLVRIARLEARGAL